MVELRDVQTGLVLARISEEQLRFLIDELEEESAYDRDYFLDEPTLQHLTERGADPELLHALRMALRGRNAVELEWSRRERGDEEAL